MAGERMTLRDLLASRFGVATTYRVNREGATAGTSGSVVLRSDPNRFGFTIINLGTAAVFVSPSRELSTTTGIRLAPSGGSLTLVWSDDLDLVSVEWWCISGSAGQTVYTLEVVAR